PDVLERSGDAERRDLVGLGPGDLATLEDHAPGRRREDPGDPVEEGGFAGPVGANEREDLTLLHAEGHVIDGHEPAETLRDVVDAQARREHLDGRGVSPATSSMTGPACA